MKAWTYVGAALALGLGCGHKESPIDYAFEHSVAASVTASASEKLEVPPPPFSKGIFPCSDCHSSQKTNPTRRVLVDEHKDIVLEHDKDHRWCLDCHNPDDRDKLRLASGELVPFEESYRLCGQCHGDKYRDWRKGVHGRRTGQWASHGQKAYLLCAHCHNPHKPKFVLKGGVELGLKGPSAPMPPPIPPEKLSHGH